MIRHRVLVDIEFTVDEARFKAAQLTDDATGVSDVTEADVRRAVAGRLIQAHWDDLGLAPQRSTVTTRTSTSQGHFVEVVVPADSGVVGS
jgi:hypothetical protein